MTAQANEDYAHFTEASAQFAKAQEHFNRAKQLFLDFKSKYPTLAQLHLPADQIFNLQPLMQAYSAPGARSLYQRRMMARQLPRTPSPGGPPSPFSPGGAAGYQSPQTPVNAGIPSANYPSFDERLVYSGGGPPSAYQSRLESHRATTGCSGSRPGPGSRFQRVQPGAPTPPLNRRLNFDSPDANPDPCAGQSGVLDFGEES